ncbi:hypothetical protein CSUB01_04527 [Colletotrichum sublineola]|uniref:Uncharacterized protein n=1 Tax=Colletotrichum sublineola TaxID=1173701 RepID=A0A066X238_COLSU|nr:hypothetical protein CSUB01_04527 [Colletotrichum sublineola]
MRFTQFTLLTLLAAYGLAAPATQNLGDNSFAEKVDSVLAAERATPFNPTWHYCQTKCDCVRRFDKSTQPDQFFQCITDPNCEQCARSGMSPSQVREELLRRK